MRWASFLPNSPDVLARLEWWLWLIAAGVAIIGVLIGVAAREVGRHRAGLLEERLTEAHAERDAKTKQIEDIADKTRRDVAAVQERQRPRTFGADERTRFLGVLNAGPKGTIYLLGAAMGDGESSSLATQLLEVLRSADWRIENYAANWVSTWNPIGVVLIVPSREKAPAHAATLQRAFDAVKIEAKVQTDAKMPEGSLTIIVGRKP